MDSDIQHICDNDVDGKHVKKNLEKKLKTEKSLFFQSQYDGLFKRILRQNFNSLSISRCESLTSHSTWVCGEQYVPLTKGNCSNFIPAHYEHHISAGSVKVIENEYTFFAGTVGKICLVRIMKYSQQSVAFRQYILHDLSKKSSASLDSGTAERNYSHCNNIDIPINSFVSNLCPKLIDWLIFNGIPRCNLKGKYMHFFHDIHPYTVKDGISINVDSAIAKISATHRDISDLDIQILKQWFHERYIALAGLQLALALKCLRSCGSAHRLVDGKWKNGQVIAAMTHSGRIVILSDSFSAATTIGTYGSPIAYVDRDQVIIPKRVECCLGAPPPEIAHALMVGPCVNEHLLSHTIDRTNLKYNKFHYGHRCEFDKAEPTSVSLILSQLTCDGGYENANVECITHMNFAAKESTMCGLYRKADIYGLGNYLSYLLKNVNFPDFNCSDRDSVYNILHNIEPSVLISLGVLFSDNAENEYMSNVNFLWSQRHSTALGNLLSRMCAYKYNSRYSDEDTINSFFALLWSPDTRVWGPAVRAEYARCESDMNPGDMSTCCRKIPDASMTIRWDSWLRKRRFDFLAGSDLFSQQYKFRDMPIGSSISHALYLLMLASGKAESMCESWKSIFDYRMK